jgi:glucuronate isomerase
MPLRFQLLITTITYRPRPLQTTLHTITLQSYGLPMITINGELCGTLGINERFITGDASDKDKFIKFAEAMPYMLRNPLYHWTHLELSRYFGIKEQLSLKNAEAVYEETSALAQTKEYSTQTLLEKMNVEMLCTTEDPIDSFTASFIFSKIRF